MKKLLFYFVLCINIQFANAQGPAIDKERLLEFYQDQRYAEAAQYLQQIYGTGSSDVKVLGQLAYCHLMSGHLPEAAFYYQKIDSIQPGTLSVYFNLANIYSKRGNYVQTRNYLEKVIQIDSMNFNALKQLPNFIDSLALRMVYLKKANLIRPTDADVAADLADGYRKQKMAAQAYQVLQIAIAADTGNFVLQQQLLPIANELKKYQEVVTIGTRLLRNDQDPNVLKDVGIAYFNLKKYDQSLPLFSAIEKMAKQNETILYYMALCYRELKDYEMSTKYAVKTIDEGISPNTAFYYLFLGNIHEMKGQNNSAA
ncbi:MAG: tetratricopeptide repeat protein, partial [Pedobacter sp.]|nr:tetratricopeptide repeat protein [Pedobacter sp.]